MAEYANTVKQVIQNLKALFEQKDRLVGYADWDNFIGCLIALESIAAELQKKDSEEVNNG